MQTIELQVHGLCSAVPGPPCRAISAAMGSTLALNSMFLAIGLPLSALVRRDDALAGRQIAMRCP
jgi:hypothetical protein